MTRQHEPLTPEEQELAAQLSRLGPHAAPSPALDSRVMAAAHAELAQASGRRRKPRWPVALGLAASVLLAVGVAWQLRPLQEAPTASEVPSVAAAPEPAREAPAPLRSADLAEQPSAADAAAPPIAPPQAFPAPAESAPAAPAASPPRQKSAASGTASRALSTPRKASARDSAPEPAAASADRYSPPPPPAAPPVMADEARADAAAAPAPVLQAGTSDAERTAVQAEQAAQAKRARDEATSNRLLLRGNEQHRRQDSAAVAASAAAQDALAEEAGSARATLRRTDLQLPVAEDAKLAPAEWLDRIRLRRDLGDSGNASASLRLFVDAHPFQRVPEDLRPLLGEE
jgi:hypothetical protein